MIAIGLLVLTAGLVNYIQWSDRFSETMADLDVIPKVIGPWNGKDQFFRDDLYPRVGADKTLLRAYTRDSSAQPIWLYVGYTKNTREYNMGPHSPKVCYPGQGWKIAQEAVVPLDLNHGPHRVTQINEMIVANGNQRRLIYYWYQSRDQVILSNFQQNYYAIWDKLLYNRSDLALVRVSLPKNGNDSHESAIAKGFIQELFPHLLQALPQ